MSETQTKVGLRHDTAIRYLMGLQVYHPVQRPWQTTPPKDLQARHPQSPPRLSLPRSKGWARLLLHLSKTKKRQYQNRVRTREKRRLTLKWRKKGQQTELRQLRGGQAHLIYKHAVNRPATQCTDCAVQERGRGYQRRLESRGTVSLVATS